MKGFTLVEMMAALFIFGLLAAAGVTVMGSTLSNQTAVRERTERLGDFQRTRAILKADLAQAAPRVTRDKEGRVARAAMTGGVVEAAPFLTLTRRGWENRDNQPRASMQYVEYSLSEGRLERRSRERLDGTAPGAAQVMIDGVEAMQVWFLYKGEWRPAWSGAPQAPLPQAVRLDLTLAGVGPVSQLFLTPGDVR